MGNFARWFVLATTLVLSSCAPTPTFPPYSPTAQFDADHARKMLEKGVSTIKGSALIRQRGGGVVTCAGQTVVLIPATEYADERMRVIYNQQDRGFRGYPDQVPMESNASYVELTRRTRCDAQGYFTFDNVGDGTFYVVTRIVWETGRTVEGGTLMQRVNVSGVETKEIVLSP